MTRALAVPLALGLIAMLPACSGREAAAPESQPVAASPSPEAAPSETSGAEAAGNAPMATTQVTLYFPSANDDALAAETREIVDTKRPADRGSQIVAALLEGPKGPGALPAFPTGTTLRQLWVRDDGSAFADFSAELSGVASGGSSDEILTVYSIVDSLTQNVAEIRRVGILVAGRERETLGHLDLRRPLAADLSLAKAAKPTE